MSNTSTPLLRSRNHKASGNNSNGEHQQSSAKKSNSTKSSSTSYLRSSNSGSGIINSNNHHHRLLPLHRHHHPKYNSKAPCGRPVTLLTTFLMVVLVGRASFHHYYSGGMNHKLSILLHKNDNIDYLVRGHSKLPEIIISTRTDANGGMARNENDVRTDQIYDVAIVGAGPAGLSAALFAARAGLQVLVLGSSATGMLSETLQLDNFPGFHFDDDNNNHNDVTDAKNENSNSGPAWLEVAKQQTLTFGAEFATPGILVKAIGRPAETISDAHDSQTSDKDVVDSTFVLETTATNNERFVHARSLILATGATPRKLGLPHENSMWGQTLHACALCDGHLYLDKRVLVVGGGDSAMDAALLLARYAQEVHVVHRRNEWSGNNVAAQTVAADTANIQFWQPYVVNEWIVTEASGLAGSVSLSGAKLRHVGDTTSSGSKDAHDSFRRIDVDGAFIMIGADPNTSFLKEVVDLTPETGLVKLWTSSSVGSTATSTAGIFAAGEIADDTYKQAITAASQGAQAAIDAERWLRQADPGELRRRKQRNNIDSRNKQRKDLSMGTATSSKDAPQRLPATENQATQRDQDKVNNMADDNCDLTQVDCIQSVVDKYPVVVFSKSYCPYCRKALEALSAAGVPHPHVIDLTNMANTQDIQSTLQQMTDRRTVPNVFLGGKSIGGGDETARYLARGQLAGLVKQAIAKMEADKALPKATNDNNAATKGGESCDLNQLDCIRDIIRKYPVVMFSLSWCPECKRSLEFLQSLHVKPPHIIDLEDYSKTTSNTIREHMLTLSQRRSVPNLFIGGEHAGGFAQTSQLHQEGKLLNMFGKVRWIEQAAVTPQQPPAEKRRLDKVNNMADDNCDLTQVDCIQSVVDKYPVVVFSKSYCPYCRKALEALSAAGVPHPHVIELTNMANTQDIQSTLQQMTDRRTVPNVFLGGKSIGGGDETARYLARGQLAGLVKQAIAKMEADKALLKATNDNNAATKGDESCDLNQLDCIRDIIRKYPVVMFSLSWCRECKRSLELLQSIHVNPPHIIDLEDYSKTTSNTIREHMLTLSQRRSVPNLFIGGEHAGGFAQTSQLHQEGKLLEMFHTVGWDAAANR